MTTTQTAAEAAVAYASEPGMTLKAFVEYLPNAGFTGVTGNAVDYAIGSLTYGQSKVLTAKSAYGGENVAVIVGYTGNGQVGGKFYWKAAVA